MIDTHCHLTDNTYNNISEIIHNAGISGVKLLINNSTNLCNTLLSLNIAKHKNIYTTAGIHPLDITDNSKNEISELIQLLNHPKIIAIGEIGLDYHYQSENKNIQKTIFEHLLTVAETFNMPVTVHARDAVSDTIDIIQNYNLKGVFHCFSGNINELKQILDLGFYIGFDGPITYKKNIYFNELIEYTPADRILCETDSPYLSPVPHRGKINQPSYVKYIYSKISEIKQIPNNDLISKIHTNTINLFGKIIETE